MVIIGMVSFPPSSSNEAGKCFPGLPSLAEFITRRGPYLSSVKGEGILGISVYEFDNSKMAEAMINVGEYYAAMMDVPGLTYSIQIFNEIQESLKMIGLE